MRLIRYAFAVLLIVGALIGAGCDKIADKVAEEAAEGIVKGATGIDVEADGDDVTITGEDGSTFTVTEDGDLPKDWPEDVPVYDGTIVSSMATGGNFTVNIESDDAAADVYEWCLSKSEDEDWTITAKYESDDGGMISGEKDDQRMQYTIGKDGEGTSLLIWVGPKEEE
ncbi:MAG: hypothetical protein CVT60_06930 [Actinobacteria bacterium HGW-Actinobacteria-10]|jgi:hypothetical protein|nr:MAG: hypothetical protein CVT60_06930 [Actinobacteria bacterium HGW-Actinobacteria-10]